MSNTSEYNLRKAALIADAVVLRYKHMSRSGYDKEGFPVLQDELNKKKIKVLVETIADTEQLADLAPQVEPEPPNQGVVRPPRNGFVINWQEMCGTGS